MAHNSRIAPDSAYVEGAGLTTAAGGTAGAWYAAIDTAQQNALNGDAGGSWTPAAAIQIQLFRVGQPWPGMRFEGPLTLAAGSGAILATPTNSGYRIVLDSGLPKCNPTRTDTTVISCGQAVDVNGLGDPSAAATSNAVMAYRINEDCVVSSRPGMHCLLPIRVHNGGLFNNATLSFSVVGGHAAVPQILPRARIIQVDANGVVTPFSVGSSGPGQWVQVNSPANVGAWNNSSQSIFMAVATNATTFDTSRYTYFCEWIDEAGTNALGGNTYNQLALLSAGINTLGFH